MSYMRASPLCRDAAIFCGQRYDIVDRNTYRLVRLTGNREKKYLLTAIAMDNYIINL